MGGKKEIVHHDVISFSCSLLLKSTFLNQSLLMCRLPAAWHNKWRGLSDSQGRRLCCFLTLPFPVASPVRFHLGPRSPVCTDLFMFPKLMGYSLSLCPFPDPVNVASHFLPWGLCRSLSPGEHLQVPLETLTKLCTSDCLLSVLRIPRHLCHGLPNLTNRTWINLLYCT